MIWGLSNRAVLLILIKQYNHRCSAVQCLLETPKKLFFFLNFSFALFLKYICNYEGSPKKTPLKRFLLSVVMKDRIINLGFRIPDNVAVYPLTILPCSLDRKFDYFSHPDRNWNTEYALSTHHQHLIHVFSLFPFYRTAIIVLLQIVFL